MEKRLAMERGPPWPRALRPAPRLLSPRVLEGGGGLRPARVERGVALGRQRRVGRDRLRRLEHLELRRLRVASAEAEERFDPAAGEEAERRSAGRIGGGLSGSGGRRRAGATGVAAGAASAAVATFTTGGNGLPELSSVITVGPAASASGALGSRSSRPAKAAFWPPSW